MRFFGSISFLLHALHVLTNLKLGLFIGLVVYYMYAL